VWTEVSVALVGPFHAVVGVLELDLLHSPSMVRLAIAHGVTVHLDIFLSSFMKDPETEVY
jgi:hypothetical protein